MKKFARFIITIIFLIYIPVKGMEQLPLKGMEQLPHKELKKLKLLARLQHDPETPIQICNVPPHLIHVYTLDTIRQTILSALTALDEKAPKDPTKNKSKKKKKNELSAATTTILIDVSKLIRLPNPAAQPEHQPHLELLEPKSITFMGMLAQEMDPETEAYAQALKEAIKVSSKDSLDDIELQVDLLKLKELLPKEAPVVQQQAPEPRVTKPTFFSRLIDPVTLGTALLVGIACWHLSKHEHASSL